MNEQPGYNSGDLIFKDYRVERALKSGGFGQVYQVVNPAGFQFALRVLFRKEFLKKGGIDAIRKIRSIYLVSVLDIGETVNEEPCVLMEFHPHTLAGHLMKKGPMRPWTGARYFISMLNGLEKLHRSNLIHRDIKPSNLFIADEILCIGDFGMTKHEDSGDTSIHTSEIAGSMCGTHNYLSPETIDPSLTDEGLRYGPHNDIWAASAVFYEMLTGKQAFPGEFHMASSRLLYGEPDWETVPEPWQAVLKTALSRKTGDRYPSLTVFREAVLQILNGDIPASKTPLPGRQGGERPLGERFTQDQTGMELVWVSGGRFRMGSLASEAGRCEDEGPVHWAEVSGFYMGIYPVTNRAYSVFQPDHDTGDRFNGLDQPVVEVSWEDAMVYCRWLNETFPLEGMEYGLPTEAEWEYACRAGTQTPFYFGETILKDQTNYDGNYSYGSGKKGEYLRHTTDVGTYPPNAFGLYDMHGNIREWCVDGFDSEFYGKPEASMKNPICNPESCHKRVLRGGSWYGIPDWLRSAARNALNPSWSGGSIGFRIVLRPVRNSC